MKMLFRAALLLSVPGIALAADNFIVKDGSGTTITKASKDIGSGVQSDKNVLIDSAGTEILGTVTASPTANTIGARLKTIADTLGGTVAVSCSGCSGGDASAANQTTLIGHVDGLEALIGTTNTNTSATNTSVGTVNTTLGTTNSTLSTISGKLPTLGTQAIGSSMSVTPATSAAFPVTDNGGSLTVDGTFWQATQPVSIATAPVLVAGSAIIGKVGIDQTTDGTTNLVAAKQSGTWNITNVSGTVSLPTGAATAAKQPALGTAGTASTDVITVQGIASGTPLIIGGSVAAGATDSGNPVKIGCYYGTSFPTYTNGQRGNIQCNNNGELYTRNPTLESYGLNISTDTADIVSNTSGIATTNTALGAPADAAWTSGSGSVIAVLKSIDGAVKDTTAVATDITKINSVTPLMGNGVTGTGSQRVTIASDNTAFHVNANIATNAPVRIVSAAGVTEDETQVCAAACTVMRVSGYNASASTRYIKFTNATAASTTPGTTAVYWSIPIPATSPFSIPVEQYFSTAATVYLVTGSADNDVAEVTAGDILGLAITTK